MIDQARIYIAIPIAGRTQIARECIPTVLDSVGPEDKVVVYVDSRDDDTIRLANEFSDRAEILVNGPLGIEAQRRVHILDYCALSSRFSHLYMTDADAPHDPSWRSELLRIQASVGGAPLCGYNTAAHANMAGNTISEEAEVIWRKFAPGISYLLTREHMERVVKSGQRLTNFDWQIPAILGYRFAVTRTSYVEHVGHMGMHHPPDAGYEGGDRALNPTPAVAKLRAEIVQKVKDLP